MNANNWSNNNNYNEFMGKWSVSVAKKFLVWLSKDNDLPKKRWIDVGCGTGSLAYEIYNYFDPEEILGIDPSPDYLPRSSSSRLCFQIGYSNQLPVESNTFDFVVSGLALNFMPDINSSIKEMIRTLKSNGCLALYVWDYSGRMDMLRYFWDTAVEIKPEAKSFDEGLLFTICNKLALLTLFENNNLKDIKFQEITIDTTFSDFESYWKPFLGGQGPAGRFLLSLAEEDRILLRTKLESKFLNKPISLLARAYAIQGRK